MNMCGAAFNWQIFNSQTAPEIIFGQLSAGRGFLAADAEFEKDRIVGIFPQMPPESADEPFYCFLTEKKIKRC